MGTLNTNELTSVVRSEAVKVQLTPEAKAVAVFRQELAKLKAVPASFKKVQRAKSLETIICALKNFEEESK